MRSSSYASRRQPPLRYFRLEMVLPLHQCQACTLRNATQLVIMHQGSVLSESLTNPLRRPMITAVAPTLFITQAPRAQLCKSSMVVCGMLRRLAGCHDDCSPQDVKFGFQELTIGLTVAFSYPPSLQSKRLKQQDGDGDAREPVCVLRMLAALSFQATAEPPSSQRASEELQIRMPSLRPAV